MARRKKLNEYERALNLYTIFVLKTDDKIKEFEALKESEKVSRVNGFKQRRKGLFVGYTLDNLHTLNSEELSKLRGDLNKYLKAINEAEKNISLREIEKIEVRKEDLTKRYNKDMSYLDSQIEKLREKIK